MDAKRQQVRELHDEKEVIGRFLARPEHEGYSALFRRFVPQLVRYFRIRGCDGALADDLAQEVMLVVYRESRQLRDPELFRPWFFRIARNALLQHHRRQVRRPEMPMGEETDSALVVTTDPLANVQFEEWMDALEPEERELMRLRYADGLQYHEIAKMLEMPQGTVQWRIFQSVRKLSARFGEPQGHTP
jgi:RNA polymerase sigma-70 factor (ECF subfamily)